MPPLQSQSAPQYAPPRPQSQVVLAINAPQRLVEIATAYDMDVVAVCGELKWYLDEDTDLPAKLAIGTKDPFGWMVAEAFFAANCNGKVILFTDTCPENNTDVLEMMDRFPNSLVVAPCTPGKGTDFAIRKFFTRH